MCFRIVKWMSLLVLAGMCVSCANLNLARMHIWNTPVNNLAPANLKFPPTVQTYQDPDANFSNYRTFSVFPASLVIKGVKTNPIMEKQILFFLRNCFEAKGYRFVPMKKHPDFVATMIVSSKYRTTYVPPSTRILPVIVPGRTITTFGNTSGTFNFNTFGNYSSYGWGSYSGQSSSTTYVPGYVTTQTYTRPGYSVGHYYPSAQIVVLDSKSLKNVWLGSGTGTSDNPDGRVAMQFVALNMIERFPTRGGGVTHLVHDAKAGIGVSLMDLTNDGNDYLPTVMSVLADGPAYKANVERFEMILSINGTSVINKPISDVMRLMDGNPGTHVKMQLWRNGQRITVNLTRAAWKDLQQQ